MKKNNGRNIVEFIKKVFVAVTTFFGCNMLKVNPLNCVLMNNQERKIRKQIININSNWPYFILTVLN